MGCGEDSILFVDAPNFSISLTTGSTTYEIKDHGACAIHPFDRYCDLGDKVDAVLGYDLLKLTQKVLRWHHLII